MRHSVNIFWGKNASECLLALHKYMLRSGEERVNNFFRSYLFVVEDNDAHFEHVIQGDDGDFKLEVDYQFAISAIGAELPKFVQNIHRQMINIHNRGDYANLHLCLYVPLLEDIKPVMSFISTIENGGFNYVDIDVVCLAGDLCHAISSEYDTDKNLLKLQKQTGDGLKQLVDFKKNQPKFQHLLAIQDYQNGGAALSLGLASLTRILGEFSLMMIEDYTSVFGNIRSESDFQTMGLSMLQLDRYYFLEYLMRKTLMHIAQCEKISITEVDINKASKQADDLLRPWTNLLSDVYRNEVKSALDRHETENEVVAKIDSLLLEKFSKMCKDLESYMTDESISLPEKKAILSAILGQDDPLFVNDIYDDELLSFNDLEREAIEQFVSTNNFILSHEDRVSEALLSENGEEAYYPISEMRKNRITLRRTVGYIRELEKEQKQLEQQMDLQEHANDCFIGEGVFTIGEHKYKLLPQVDDVPLKEQYTPHPTQTPSVDLSNQMPRVKDQGQQGTCLAFSLTSIFEYMYKKMTQQQIDLSEQFLYYIAREKAGDTDKDEGSCLNYAVEALAEKGLCTEEKWAYNTLETAYDIRPSDEAYQEALDRKLAEAKNVALDVDAIRSALSDGYPVVISARLYDSFGEARSGYVPMPSDEERQAADSKENRNHAMVIVGYNDEIHAFKVRNSWGENFGLGGYVLMPYAYITDTSLTNYAAILTEIRLAQTITEKYIVQQPGKESITNIPRLEFDRSDSKTQYGINKILIDDAKALQRKLEQIDATLSLYCLHLKQKLKNPNVRQALRKSADECYTADIEAKETEINSTIQQKSNELDSLESQGRRKYILYGLMALLLAIAFIIIAVVRSKLMEDAELHTLSIAILSQFLSWKVIIGSYLTLGVAFLIFYTRYRKNYKEIVESYDDTIDQLTKEKGELAKAQNELGIKCHLAGSMLTQFFVIHDQLETKSKILESFLLNIRKLVDENEEILKKMSPNVQPPFIPMLKNEELDAFFVKKAIEFAGKLHLYNFFEGYSISSEAFADFRAELKKQMNLIIEEILKDFSMYKYISGKEKFTYLLTEERQITDYLEEMDEKSEVFMLCNDTKALNPSKAIYLHTEPDEAVVWQNTYGRAFSTRPVCVNIASRFKIILIRLLDMNLSQIEWYKVAKY